MSAKYEGEVKARILDVRFALSGKIASVSKHTGDKIKKWGIIASLDRKILQTELDSELLDYEKVRADFEILALKYPNPTDSVEKYLKTAKNAELNRSVKNVELAKTKLDQINLLSPVDGMVIDDSGIVPGLNITPASSSIKIIDTSSYYFEFEIAQLNIHDLISPRKAKVLIPGISGVIEGETSTVLPIDKKFIVRVSIPGGSNVLLGMKGEVKF